MKKSTLTKLSFFLGLLLFMLAVQSCKSRKKLLATKEIPTKSAEKIRVENASYLEKLNRHQAHYITFSGKAKSALNINDNRQDVTVNLRMRAGKAIWMSITALLGLEVARLYITPDSIQVINRLQKTYLHQPFSFIYKYTGDKITFDDLQAFFTGRSISMINENTTITNEITEGFLFHGQKDELDYAIQTNTAFEIVATKLIDFKRQQRLLLNYDNYQSITQYKFPKTIIIHSENEATDLSANLNLEQIKINTPIEMPFQPPKHYIEID